MTPNNSQHIFVAAALILAIYFAVTGLIHAREFLMPIAAACLLAMLLLPFSKKLESLGANRTIAAVASLILLLLLTLLILFVLIDRIEAFSEDLPKLVDNIEPRIGKLERFISEHTGISPWNQEEKLSSFLRQRVEGIASGMMSFIADIPGFLMTTLLVFVYTFFFILYRGKFTRFVLEMVQDSDRDRARRIIDRSSKVAQQYLLGRLVLIILLALVYYIGLSILNLSHAIFISAIAATLSILPYIGNILGLLLTLVAGLMSGFGFSGLLGIVILFVVSQLLESYVLTPYIAGSQVNLNAVISVVAIVFGGLVWGIAGAILALPLIGIVKVICDSVPQLHPFGYVLGEEGRSMKGLLTKIWHKIP